MTHRLRPLAAAPAALVAPLAVVAGVLGYAGPAAAADSSPARGAPLGDIIPATVVAALATLVVTGVAVAYRRGRSRFLRRLAALAEQDTGLPAWAAVPASLTTTSLVVAVFGFYWDVSWHIDRGRDPGPFANPAHWFIIVGLAGVALSGVLAMVLGDERAERTGVRITQSWTAPVGGVALAVCGVIALAGFPLDDVWHRLFGQDVTLWGPTHIQMIGGASLATLALWALLVEGSRVRSGEGHGWGRRLIGRRDVLTGGAFLVGLSTLQGEFDFGVPQFRHVYHPVLIVLAASIALVAVRIRAGRGAAIGAACFFLALRGGLALLIGPVLGRSVLHFPLYLAEAGIVELAAWRLGRERQLTLGLWSGIGIGTVGLAAEWAWSHAWMPLPWHASLLPEAAVLALVAAVAGGLIGGLVGRAVAPPDLARQPTPRLVVALASVGALAALAWPLPMTAGGHVNADVSLSAVQVHGQRRVEARVRLDPPEAARRANWFNVTAWQGAKHGRGGLVIAPFHRVGPGQYVTTTPAPVSGTWKAIIRLHRGRDVLAAPIYLPADRAIPAAGVSASPHVVRSFVRDKAILQREAVGDRPGLERLAYAVLGLLGAAWIGSLAWGLRRLDRSAGPTVEPVPALRAA